MCFKGGNEFLRMLQPGFLLHVFESALRSGSFRGKALSPVTGIGNKNMQTTPQLHTTGFESRIRSKWTKAQSKSHWQLLQYSS